MPLAGAGTIGGPTGGADFDKGVLEVRIPKPAERKPHRVQIGASVNGKAQEK